MQYTIIEIKHNTKLLLDLLCIDGFLSFQILYHKNHTHSHQNEIFPCAPHECANSFLQDHILHIYWFSSIFHKLIFKYMTSINSKTFECFVAQTACFVEKMFSMHSFHVYFQSLMSCGGEITIINILTRTLTQHLNFSENVSD